MKAELDHKVKFDFIRYANCWEDADILLAGLKAAPGGRILSIASAGDNSLSLLTTDPELLLAVDVNPVQLYLTELKMLCFKELEYEDILAFLGINESTQRLQMFQKLSPMLSSEARAYWEAQSATISAGIVRSGKFERYFGFFRKWILPLIHSAKTNRELFALKTGEQQQQFYQNKWNSWRWKLFFKIFFSRFVMGRFGRDPEFLKQVQVPVAEFIYGRAARHLLSVDAQQNFFLQFIHLGRFETQLPHYLRKENHQKIRQNIGRMKLMKGFAEEAFPEHGSFNSFNLSNIFEYMDQEIFSRSARTFAANAAPGARLAYWNLMVPRYLSAVDTSLQHDKMLSEQLSEKDRGFFYHRFIVDMKHGR